MPALAPAETVLGKTRLAILAVLLARPDESFYLREVIRAARVGHGAGQRELATLTRAGVIRRTARGNQVHFQANRDCLIFAELHSIVLKTAGLADVLRRALRPLASHLLAAWVYGSLASGEQTSSSDVDLFVVGDVSLAEIVHALRGIESELGREVNPTLCPPVEFRQKLASGHRFVTSAVTGPKIFLVGDEGGLAELGTERMDQASPGKPPGDRGPLGRRRSRSR
jgi:predicted nucleotidyltransferase